MDNVRDVFNILLLSISLTTVLVTLISFLIFKLRYSIKSKSKEGVFELEGSYFRRYAPEIRRKNEEAINLSENISEVQLRPQTKILITFGSVFVLIFSFLAAENYFSFRFQLNKKYTQAQNIRKLIENGLLKKYTYNPKIDSISLNEKISPYLESVYLMRLRELKSHTITLISDPTNIKKGNTFHIEALKRWRRFLKRNNISYQESSLHQLPKNGLVIGAHLNYLSSKKTDIILESIETGNLKFLFTGFPGKYTKDDQSISQIPFGSNHPFQFIKNKRPDHIYPSQFIGNYDLPAGQVSQHFPLDNSLRFNTNRNSLALLARESDYMGSFIEDGTHYLDQEILNAKIVWSALDPYELSNVQKNIEIDNTQYYFYSDLYFLNLMNIAVQSPMLAVAPWKKSQYTGATSITIDTEDNFKSITIFLNLLIGHKLKGTFFLVSDLITQAPEVSYEKYVGQFEFASHTKDHKSLLEQRNKELFFSLQKTRFDIEEATGEIVVGLRPPKEEISPQNMAAVIQNKFQYIFGPKYKLRFTPYILEKNEFVFIPRTLRDDYNFSQDKTLVNAADFSKALIKDLDWVLSAAGYHPVSFHTQIFGDDFYESTLDDYAKEISKRQDKVWVTTVRDVASWWKKRANLRITMTTKGDKPSYTLENIGESNMTNFDIISKNLSSHCHHRDLVSNGSKVYNYTIKSLSAGEKINIDLCSFNLQ